VPEARLDCVGGPQPQPGERSTSALVVVVLPSRPTRGRRRPRSADGRSSDPDRRQGLAEAAHRRAGPAAGSRRTSAALRPRPARSTRDRRGGAPGRRSPPQARWWPARARPGERASIGDRAPAPPPRHETTPHPRPVHPREHPPRTPTKPGRGHWREPRPASAPVNRCASGIRLSGVRLSSAFSTTRTDGWGGRSASES
jgi:hypothetical protein